MAEAALLLANSSTGGASSTLQEAAAAVPAQMATVTAAAASNSTSTTAETSYVSPWGPVAAVMLCLAPILLLAAVTLIKRISLPSGVSLPLSAALLALIRLAYFQSPALFIMASIARGCLEALTPLSVIFGAILLFESMEQTQCLPWMMFHVRNLSAGHPLAEVFLIAWSFAYVLSGVGGFNTFILGAPMLVSLGHDPKMTVVVLVILNTLASHMGSVGMAIWFGFKSLGLGEANILLVGLKSSIIVGLAAFIVAPIAASHLVPWADILRSSLFVVLSILSAVVPTVLFSIFSAEFPVLIGGLVSMGVTALLVYYRVGLRPSPAGLAAGPGGPPTPDCQMFSGIKPAAKAAGLVPAAAAAAGQARRGRDLEAQLEDGSSHGISSSSSSIEETGTDEPSAHSSNACSCRNARLLSITTSSDECTSSRPGTGPSAAGHTDDGNSEASHKNMLTPQHVRSHPPECCMPAAGAEAVAAAAEYRSLATISCPLPCYSNAPGLGLGADAQPAPPSLTSQRAKAPSHDAEAGGQSTDRPSSCQHRHSRSLQQQLPPLLLEPENDPLLLLPPDSLAGSYHFPYSLPQQHHASCRPLLPCTNPLHLAAMQAAGVIAAGGRYYSAAGGPPSSTAADYKHRRSWHGQLPSQEQLMSFTCPGRILQTMPPPATAAGGLPAAGPGGGSLQRVSLQRVLAAAASGTRDELDAAVEAALAEEAAVFGFRCRGVRDALCRTLPIWLTVLLLLVTRIPQLHIRAALQSTTPGFSLVLGSLGVFRLSASLVIQLQEVLSVSGVNWKYETFYVPCFLPFVVASLACIALHRPQMPGSWHRPLTTAARKTRDTLSAILGALVLSELLAAGGDGSPAHILGFYLSAWLGRGYLAIAGVIGALGSFVSGSVLTGNMAFGSIQMVAAERLGVPLTGMLAVQVAGACAGKMLCISNILAGKVVLRELGHISEGEIVKHTIGVAGLFVLLGQAMGLVFTLGGLLPDAPLP